jgi:hypothetical protein
MQGIANKIAHRNRICAKLVKASHYSTTSSFYFQPVTPQPVYLN